MAKVANFQAALSKLADREWRLDNLYWITNEDGQAVPFKRNTAQIALWQSLHYRNTILKARQLGFSTFIAIICLDQAMFDANTGVGIIDLTLDDATKKLDKIRFAYGKLPKLIRDANPLTKDNTTTLEFSNGSSINVGTSLRGSTTQVLHISEYGKIAAQFPDKAKEIRTGALGTVHKNGWIFVESTAEGQGGDFYNLVQRGEALQKQGKVLSQLDFKLHFFPWWQHPSYHIDPEGVIIEPDLREYFAELSAKHGIDLTDRQRAWYAITRHTIGFDEMWREYPSIPEEPFKVSVDGAYFKQQMTKMRETRRLGIVPYDPSLPVNTFWDIGYDDNTAVWFHQATGNRNFLIDYYQNAGEDMAHYIRILKERAQQHGYIYGTHYGPHDLDRHDMILPSEKRKVDIARDLGIHFEIVPRIQNKNDAIEAARSMLNTTWIDEEKCAHGISCLDNYRKQWDERLGRHRSQPLHDWASDCADALMTGACGYRPEYMPPPVDPYASSRQNNRSAWAV